jgi:ABC-type sugar transport system substrate-binding protein
MGVITAVKALRGEKVEPAIDTGCVLVTKDNQKDPAVKEVLGK